MEKAGYSQIQLNKLVTIVSPVRAKVFLLAATATYLRVTCGFFQLISKI